MLVFSESREMRYSWGDYNYYHTQATDSRARTLIIQPPILLPGQHDGQSISYVFQFS
jgi:hypothetical protein